MIFVEQSVLNPGEELAAVLPFLLAKARAFGGNCVGEVFVQSTSLWQAICCQCVRLKTGLSACTLACPNVQMRT